MRNNHNKQPIPALLVLFFVLVGTAAISLYLKPLHPDELFYEDMVRWITESARRITWR